MAIRVVTPTVLVSTLLIAFIGCSSNSSTSDGGSGAPGASGSSGGTPAQSGATGLSGSAGAALGGTSAMTEGGSSGSSGNGTAGALALGGSSGAGGSGGGMGGSAGQPQGGSSAGSAAAGASGASGSGSAFSEVQAIFDAHCINCHDKSKVGLPSYPALSLVAGDARAALVNQPALETCGGKYVIPGAPEQSYLLKKLSEPTPCDGVRMPRPFEVGVVSPLSDAELATIRSWISAGAH